MTTGQLVKALEKYGITATRQTIYNDIELLNRHGYDVIRTRGKTNKYFVEDRRFERPEEQVY